VALVHVHDARIDAQRAQRGHPAGAEHGVLRQARVRVAVVQARGDPARDPVVLGQLGVEQEERHTADVDPPDLRGHVELADRDRDADRRALVAFGDQGGRGALRVGGHPELLLPAGLVDALAEVAAAVHEADGDERQREVRGLLEDVAGQRAEAAGVDRQRAVHAVLGAEVRDGALGRDDVGAERPGEVGLDALLDGLGSRDERVVGRRAQQRLGRRLLQQAHGVAVDQPPAAVVDRPEEVGPVGHPRPPVVVGEAAEDAERPGQP
jgi:hypothetical protein